VDEPPCLGIVIAVQIVVQPGFIVVILALKPQRVVDLGYIGQCSIGAVITNYNERPVGSKLKEHFLHISHTKNLY
jgi:hypothetical protein